MNEIQKSVIENYVNSYNTVDIDGMTKDLHPDVIFENVANETVALRTEGVAAFKEQAESALGFFTDREQRITSWEFHVDVVSIDIVYKSTLAINLPNGMNAGDVMELKGQSVFTFMNGQIIMIQDIS